MKTETLIQVDTRSNHNKFYRVALADDGAVTCTWGRVGATGQSQVKGQGEDVFKRCVEAKLAKGYRAVNVATSPQAPVHRSAKTPLAAPGHESDARLQALIERLVALNAHDLSANSGGKITVIQGQVTTPLGLLTFAALDQAEALLNRLDSGLLTRDEQLATLEHYLTLVPQRVASRRGWADAFLNAQAMAAQRTFVGQLRDSVEFASKSAAPDAGDLFANKLAVVDPGDERFAQVQHRFQRSANRAHTAVAKMAVKNVFELVNPQAQARFEAASKVGNVRQMWHGTRAFNVLSILSRGYVVPDARGRFVTGRMFGDGVYFSEQSTKSLNYARGVWAGTRDQGSCFMVLNDVATGWQYRPTSAIGNDWAGIRAGRVTDHGRRYDSIYVKAGTAGVANHECIIWNLDQIRARFLVEFA